MRRLKKSDENEVLCGVCGGIGEYLDVDPVVIRLILVCSVLFYGVGIIPYIILAIIMPDAD